MRRTITLTNREPVIIEEEEWPDLAQAPARVLGEPYAPPAQIRVRRHADGRTLVYAVGVSGYGTRTAAGFLLQPGRSLPAAIEDTAVRLAIAGHRDRGLYLPLAQECIAALPAVRV